MPEHAYTDKDLRAEAARQLATQCEDIDFMGIAERMEGREIKSLLPPEEADGAEGVRWDQLDRDQFDEAHHAIDNLLTSAADTSGWAVDLGADGLEPDGCTISLGALEGEGDEAEPHVRLHFAFSLDMSSEYRSSFIAELEGFLLRYLPSCGWIDKGVAR